MGAQNRWQGFDGRVGAAVPYTYITRHGFLEEIPTGSSRFTQRKGRAQVSSHLASDILYICTRSYITRSKHRHLLQPTTVIIICFLLLYVHLHIIHSQSACIPLPSSRLERETLSIVHLRLCSTHAHSSLTKIYIVHLIVLFANLSFPVAKDLFQVF
ncbi:hypothetical protein F4680DRAFT_239633 [Xylaria scruposa]|nr:hypothetical protein F4680DRAFT_239633 [Xylaria scruposa]